MVNWENRVGPVRRQAWAGGWSLILLFAFLVLTFFLGGVTSRAQNEKQKMPDYPRLFKDVARHLNRSYLDLERINARRLIQKSFAALENASDEIFVENSDPTSSRVIVHVYSAGHEPGEGAAKDPDRRSGGASQAFDLDTIHDLDDAVQRLESVFEFIKRHYAGETPLNEIRYAAVNAFLMGLDPHTVVISPEDFKDFSVHIEGEICGVGMYVGTRDGKLTVIEVLRGDDKETPAFRAGFKKGDLIAKIGDESTINMTVNEAVDKIRGPCGSKVTLTIKRASPGDPDKLEPMEITVKRDSVKIKSVESALIPAATWDPDGTSPWKGGVGYVQVINFDKNTTPALIKHLSRLVGQNGNQPLAGLILDLRGNSGGLLTQAVNMSDLFLRSGEIVVTASRDEDLQPQKAKEDGDEPEYPIVVLANEASASGAEIVIGALQKNNRAVVLGTRTFGKGSVQQLHELAHFAQLKITVSEYLIPGNISIQENGVVPDLLGQAVVEEDEFDLFPNERSVAERNYDTHLVSKYARKESSAYTLHYLFAPAENDPYNDRFMSGELEPAKDKLVQMATSVLRLAGKPFDPRKTLFSRSTEVQRLKDDLFTEIVQRLKEKGIDWSAGPGGAAAPATSQLDLALSTEMTQEPSKEKDDPIPVNTLIVKAKLTNRGDKPIYRIKGLSKSEYFLYRDREFLFGKVEPGQTLERAVKVRLPYFPYSRNDLFTVELSSTGELPAGEGAPVDPVVLTQSIPIELIDTGRPAFAYSARLLDGVASDALNGLAESQDAILRVKIRNTGSAPAHKGVAILRNETGRQIFLHKGRIEFSNLAPGSETEVEFGFEVRSGEAVDSYKLELVVADSYSSAVLSQKLAIPRKDAIATMPFPNDVEFAPPAIVAFLIDPETKKAVVVTSKERLELDALIRPPGAGRFKAWVYNSVVSDQEVPPDKIYFADSHGTEPLKIAAQVPLKKGINLFTVVSNDKNGLESRQNLVVRRE